MMEKKIISALQYVDPELIDEAMQEPITVPRSSGFRFSTLIAACLCLVCSLTAFWYLGKIKNDKIIEPTLITAETLAEDPVTKETMEYPEDMQLSIALITPPNLFEGRTRIAYNACDQWVEENSVRDFAYYNTPDESTESYVSTIHGVVEEGYNVIMLPDSSCAEAITETAHLYPEVYFIALDLRAEDMGDYDLPDNVCAISYQEEVAGFMAGVAAVKMGYKELYVLGSTTDSDMNRYDYGFMQGADYAAGAIGEFARIIHINSNTNVPSAEVTAWAEQWYAAGAEVIFTCNLDLSICVAEAALNLGGKMITVENDHTHELLNVYGYDVSLISVVEELEKAISYILTELYNENWAYHGGQYHCLGLRSGEILEKNFLSLNEEYTQYNESFPIGDYEELVADLANGNIAVEEYTGQEYEPVHIAIDGRGMVPEGSETDYEIESTSRGGK